MLEFKIFTPNNNIFERDDCSYISLSNEHGDFGIYPHHEKTATFCSMGIIYIYRKNYIEKIYVSQGNVFIDYFSVTIFSDFYFLKDDINLDIERSKLNELNSLLNESENLTNKDFIIKQIEDCSFKISLF